MFYPELLTLPSFFAVTTSSIPEPSPWFILPFVLLLLAIATAPFINKSWWEHHYPKVAIGLGAVVVFYYAFGLHHYERLEHTAAEYISFLSLIGSLFVVAGGIHITVKGEATPYINTLYLAIGAIVANLIGTTGASMLLIRPWIRMNKYRITGFHVVFFIFIVSNVAGSLTPIGDPPLFLGYLKHIPFFWTLEHLWQPWLLAIGLLLGVFFVFDSLNFKKAPREVRDKETAHETWRFDGLHNLIFLAIILGAVFINQPPFLREVIMIAAAVGSYFSTSKPVHESNHFTFDPIKEVGLLFLGIFATMMPALDYLQLHAAEFGVDHPLEFYYFTGALSSVLDNAPTYLTFLSALVGLQGLNLDNPQHVALVLQNSPASIMAISLGAVFFGAMTYIGNGPNFMVKAIADHAHVHTPHFFRYIFRYSLPILLPILTIVGVLFFWR